MSRRRRQQEARDLVERARVLPPEQVGLIMSVLLGNALVSLALQVVLLITGVRTARRAARLRGDSTRALAHAVLAGPLVPLACVYGVHRVVSRNLLIRWVRQTVQRAEGGDQGRAGQPAPVS